MVNRFGCLKRWIEDNPHFREVLFGSSLGLFVKVLTAILAFLMNIVIARKLGPAEAGLFFLGFTLVVLLASVGRMGLDNSVMRFVARARVAGDTVKLHGLYRKALLWGGGLCLLFMLVLLASNQLLVNFVFEQPGFGAVLPIMVMALPLVGLYTLHVFALLGLKKIIAGVMVLTGIVPLTMLAGLLIFPVTRAQEVAWVYLVGCALALVIGVFFWHRAVPGKEQGVKLPAFPSDLLYASCMPLWGVVILGQVIQWSSQLLMGVWGSVEDVALFAVAQRTAMLIGFALFAVNASAGPKFAALYSQGNMVGLERIALWSVRLILLVAVPSLIFMMVFPQWLMGLFGPQFRAASTALMILAVGQFIGTAVGSVGSLLSMTGHERQLRWNVFIGAVLGVGLGVLLIPGYGLIGAAIATSVAVASKNLLCVYQVNQLLGFNTLAIWRKI
ncbi:oligosaccharide flippase family protein [Porticoccus hydrocarbonoclasticus]|uniref:oligosaccharide flippase family protein n=1 Tax=Porticoccus hydrocarbonoclasticus TaxID=1073414 RepID=UPI000568B0A7|nr:polysaccharide biosynthesis C-terminal domain-containing protein [Porticoccus hydrocarbonoclasticus]